MIDEASAEAIKKIVISSRENATIQHGYRKSGPRARAISQTLKHENSKNVRRQRNKRRR